MKTDDMVWKAVILGRFVPQDPNEIAIAQLAEWMKENDFEFHFHPWDNEKPTLNMGIVFKDGDGGSGASWHRFKHLYDTNPDLPWRPWVLFDYRDKPHFQRKLCIHCDRRWEEHEEGKCLFGSTTFTVKKGAT